MATIDDILKFLDLPLRNRTGVSPLKVGSGREFVHGLLIGALRFLDPGIGRRQLGLRQHQRRIYLRHTQPRSFKRGFLGRT
ncbi:MAG: hypothetical protein E5Y76_05145, partial [Mesorhizobium sp.]